ncbi:AraC family transcriptional regulator [Dysgonomonas sp. 216]|uniref:AraC family transcriptional regulator n=1 Tax=Dysgonomonas sp. 216 TaxID=2302934 RepID=UPI0013D518F9|nr:AraC family transcriptional regulator [Dysgonomonas sp. 216]NDW18433.1 AraC family transcriptional regulator [Dysgonomonas sp. 216]
MKKGTMTREDYAKRINIVIEHIGRNLDREITLNELSEVSNFSPFHFHRIFRAIIGEPIGAFVVRMRVETAARLLRYTSLPVQDIAYSVGYNTPSSLTKVFRQFYNISPNDYRNNKSYTIMKPLQLNPDINLKAPKIVEQEEKNAIYVRLQGNYQSVDYCGAFNKLWAFVKENKLFSAGIEHVTLSHDDPKVTETDKLRTDVCLVVHKPAKPQGEVGVRTIPGGKFAVFTYVGPYSNLYTVFDTIYRKWLPESGYQVRMEQGFERYLNNPDKTEESKLKTEIYIPIE